jgi:hypothetical protein
MKISDALKSAKNRQYAEAISTAIAIISDAITSMATGRLEIVNSYIHEQTRRTGQRSAHNLAVLNLYYSLKKAGFYSDTPTELATRLQDTLKDSRLHASETTEKRTRSGQLRTNTYYKRDTLAAIAAVAAVAVDDGVIPNTARDYLKGIYHYCNWLKEAFLTSQ